MDYGYLNYGLKSGAKYYFGRLPKDLTKAEQIALLILPKDSDKYNPYKKPKNFRTRFESVTGILLRTNIITADEQKDILSEKLVWRNEHGNPLPYVADFLKTKTPETGNIVTAFDRILSEQIDAIAKSTLNELLWKNVSEYGVLIAERKGDNPELRVMIGGSDYRESVA